MKERALTTLGFLSVIAILLTGIYSCDDDVTYGDPQTPILSSTPDLFYLGGILDVEDFYEMGCTVEFLRNGRITQLCVFVPDNGIYRVTLWDATTKMVLRSVNIEAEEARPACVDIPHQMVYVGDSLAITVYSNDFYVYRSEVVGRPIYPIDIGDVRLVDFGVHINPVGFEIPDLFDFFSLQGVAEFVFEPEV